MTERRLPVSTKHPLGTFGLLLILLVAKLAEYSDPSHQNYRRRAQAFLARRAIDGVTAIGWIVDRYYSIFLNAVRDVTSDISACLSMLTLPILRAFERMRQLSSRNCRYCSAATSSGFCSSGTRSSDATRTCDACSAGVMS